MGLEEAKILNLMSRFFSTQVATLPPLMSPESSIYDLYKAVFAKSAVMLKEHFRCVGPIIEYSKREFYNHGYDRYGYRKRPSASTHRSLMSSWRTVTARAT